MLAPTICTKSQINLFIRARVDTLRAQLELTQAERDLLLVRLTSVPNRTYLWVYLTLDLIEASVDDSDGISKKRIFEATSTLPQTVDEAYKWILSRSKNSKQARKILHIIIAAARPLTLQELNVALTLRDEHQSYRDMRLMPDSRFREQIRDLCGLFIMVVGTRIYLLHQTAKEFLLQQVASDGWFQSFYRSAGKVLLLANGSQTKSSGNSSRILWRHSFKTRESHRILAVICLQYLRFADFRSDTLPTGGETWLTGYYVFLEYSSRYWTVHLSESDIDYSAVKAPLLDICNARTACKTWLLIYWKSTGLEMPSGMTSLMIASYFGLTEVVKHLMSGSGTKSEIRDGTYRRTALSWAAGNGHDPVVEVLTRGYWEGLSWIGSRVDAADKHGRTPLAWACLNGHVQAVRSLLKAGANVGATEFSEATPLYYAICNGSAEVIELVMTQDGQIQSRDDLHARFLLEAVRRNDELVVRLLLEQGADVSQPLLPVAAEIVYQGVLTLLLEHDAEVDARSTHHCRIPLTWDRGDGTMKSPAPRMRPTASGKGICRRTPLSWAAGSGHERMVRLLLSYKAEVEAGDSWCGRTPLLWAAGNGHTEIVRLLLEHNAEVEAKDSQCSRTSLSWAAERGHAAVVNLLLTNNADMRCRDPIYHRTPFMWAAENRHYTVMEALLEKAGSESGMHKENFRDLFSAAALLFEPLSTKALSSLLRVPRDRIVQQLRALDFIRPISETPPGPNEFHHFLRLHLQPLVLDIGSALRPNNFRLHGEIAAQCLEIMDLTLKRNICGLSGYVTRCIDIQSRCIAQSLPEDLQYACRHWAYHFVDSDTWSSDAMLDFLEFHFLHWFEAMSIINRGLECFDAVNALLANIKKTNSRLIAFLHEARRFLLRSVQISKIAPMQLYISALAFSPRMSMIRSLFEKEALSIMAVLPSTNPSWSTQFGTISGPSEAVQMVGVSPDSQLITSSSGNTLRLWDTGTGQQVRRIKSGPRSIWAVHLSADRQIAVSGTCNGIIQVWRAKTGLESLRFQGHRDPVCAVAVSFDGKIIASGSYDKTVRLWRLQTGKQLHVLQGHSSMVQSVAFSPNNELVFSCSADDTARLWDTTSGRPVIHEHLHLGWSTATAFSPNNEMIATGTRLGAMRVWSTQGRLLWIIKGNSDGIIHSLAFSSDSQILASGSDDSAIRLWDTGTGQRIHTLRGHSDAVLTLSYAPDSRVLVSGSSDHTIRLWDTNSDFCATNEREPSTSSPIRILIFSPDGQRVASCSRGNEVRLWDTETGKMIRTEGGSPSASVETILFSSDSTTLVASCSDYTLQLIDAMTGTLLRTVDAENATNYVFRDESQFATKEPNPQITIAEGWITVRGEKMLWLPLEYRQLSCFATRNRALALGHKDGQVYIMKFRCECPP